MIALTFLLAAAAMPATAPALMHARTPRHVRIAKVRQTRHLDPRFRLANCTYSATRGCAAPRSRYRLADDRAVDPTSKDRAMAESGTRCALIGQTICPSRPRTILRIPE